MLRTRISCVALLLAVGVAVNARASATLYERLGGQSGVAQISNTVIDMYMADPRLAAYFDNINPDYLKPRFAAFICKVSGGNCPYKGRSMAATHKGLHIDEAAFNAVVEDLQITMNRLDVPFRTQNRLLAILAPMERDIVTR